MPRSLETCPVIDRSYATPREAARLASDHFPCAIAPLDAHDRGRWCQDGVGQTVTQQHTIEVFSAGCAACDEVIDLVNRVAAPGSHVRVLDMRDAAVAASATALGIRSVPSVVIDGELASCCASRGVD